MIEYNKYRLFSSTSEECAPLDMINDISIKASGISLETSDETRVMLSSVKISHDTPISIELSISIPILGIKIDNVSVELDNNFIGSYEHNSTVASNVQQSQTLSVTILASDAINDMPDGLYKTNAVVRLNKIKLSFKRYISVDGSKPIPGVDLVSGYNVDIKYYNDTLSIIGGPGLGVGKYYGPTNDKSKHLYKGIQSINGNRIDQSVNITLSDMLTMHGAYVTTDKVN